MRAAMLAMVAYHTGDRGAGRGICLNGQTYDAVAQSHGATAQPKPVISDAAVAQGSFNPAETAINQVQTITGVVADSVSASIGETITPASAGNSNVGVSLAFANGTPEPRQPTGNNCPDACVVTGQLTAAASTVPEPASAALPGFGVLGLVTIRRRVMSLPREMPALHGLRGVAILMVLLIHCFGGWRNAVAITMDTDAILPMTGLPDWLAAISLHGSNGVQLFFLVSAFTLTVQAGRRNDGWLAYAARRVARIGPGYWLAGIAYTLAAGTAPRMGAPDGTGLLDWIVAALFGQSWQGGGALAVVPGGWSISCEATFYVALPLVLLVVRGSLWRAVALTAGVLLIAQLRARHSVMGGFLSTAEYVHPFMQAPVFMLGVTGALIAQRIHLPRLPGVAIALLGYSILALPLLQVAPWHVAPHLAFALIAAPAVALAAVYPPKLLVHPMMQRIGHVSYSMYLLHFALLTPCLIAAERMAPGDNWRTLALHLVLTTGCSFALACVTYRWVEQPCINAAARLLRARRAAYVAQTVLA